MAAACAGSTMWPSLRISGSSSKLDEITKVTDVVKLDDDVVRRVMSTMESEMKLGLIKEKKERVKSSLQMEITYVRALLDGTENGEFLALDLGGTNFRILLIEMRSGKLTNETIQCFTIPPDILSGQSSGVFDFLAGSIKDFLVAENLQDRTLPLGFTFSFPMEQKNIRSGVLVTWTKSFKVTGGVGEDAVKNLEDAISRKGGFSVDIVAVVNDTTGTQMAGSYIDHNCQIGLVLGTGSNACYMEHLENIYKWSDPVDEPNQVIIDTEWGAFGDNGVIDFMKTEYDFQVNNASNHVDSFTFEKLFSGMYMGEVVRLILVRLCERCLIFNGRQSERLSTPWKFDTSCISRIEKDSDDMVKTSEVIEELGLADIATNDDKKVIRYLCSLISIRAAQLVAAGIAVLLNHIKKDQVTVAIDGSLYEHHPTLRTLIEREIQVYAPKSQCKLIMAKDGSGRGAAFVAAVAFKKPCTSQ